MPDTGIARLRLAMALLAAAAAALIVGQKHLLAQPGPGLALALACALPFAIDARWPRLLRPAWPLAAAMLLVLGGATALLFYRPAEGDAAVLFFIVLAARVAGGVDPQVSVPAGVLIVAAPLVAGALGGSRTPVMAAIGAGFAWVAGSAVRAQATTARSRASPPFPKVVSGVPLLLKRSTPKSLRVEVIPSELVKTLAGSVIEEKTRILASGWSSNAYGGAAPAGRVPMPPWPNDGSSVPGVGVAVLPDGSPGQRWRTIPRRPPAPAWRRRWRLPPRRRSGPL